MDNEQAVEMYAAPDEMLDAALLRGDYDLSFFFANKRKYLKDNRNKIGHVRYVIHQALNGQHIMIMTIVSRSLLIYIL